LEECQLCDVGYTGPKFSWSNKRKDATFTKERLGQAVANKEWCALFQVVFVTILASRTSDHNPVYVQFSEQTSEWQSYKWGFKFKDSWNTDDDTFFTNFSAFYKVLNLMFLLYHAFSIIYSNCSGKSMASQKYAMTMGVLGQRRKRLVELLLATMRTFSRLKDQMGWRTICAIWRDESWET